MSRHNFRIYRFQPYNSQETDPITYINTTDSQNTDSNSQLILQTDLYNNNLSHHSHDTNEIPMSTSHHTQMTQQSISIQVANMLQGHNFHYRTHFH